jgi:NarL family two-component system response regulator LiaR
METSAKHKIVLIDGHEIVRVGLAQIINAEPDLIVVAQCGDAQTGLQEIINQKADVVLVDINVSGTSVFDVLKSALQQIPHLKIIFLTGDTTDTNVEKAFFSGASGFVTKKESLSTIVSAIREVIGQRVPYLSSEVKQRLINLGRLSQETSNESLLRNLLAKKSLLSAREIEVLSCVARGQSAKQIAGNLHISAKTVERHKSNIMSKLSLHTQVDLTRYAIREGIISA